MKLHPRFLEQNGEKQFAILPYEEFLALQERLAEAETFWNSAKRKKLKEKSPQLHSLKSNGSSG